jgi:hypothetical protein
VGEKSEAVADQDIMEKAGFCGKRGHGRRLGRIADIDDPQPVAVAVHRRVEKISLEPDIVDARLKSLAEAADDRWRQGVEEIEQSDAVETVGGAFMGEHRQGAIGPDLDIIDRAGINNDLRGGSRRCRIAEIPGDQPVPGGSFHEIAAQPGAGIAEAVRDPKIGSITLGPQAAAHHAEHPARSVSGRDRDRQGVPVSGTGKDGRRSRPIADEAAVGIDQTGIGRRNAPFSVGGGRQFKLPYFTLADFNRPDDHHSSLSTAAARDQPRQQDRKHDRRGYQGPGPVHPDILRGEGATVKNSLISLSSCSMIWQCRR